MPVVGRAPLAAGCSGRASPGKAKPHPLDGALLRLSKKWLAPLFRGVHSSLAPTARPGSYARKPLLLKAFCGFDAHVAKSDQSLRGGKAERRQWREERGGSPVSKGAPERPHGPTQRDLCELHCGPRTPGGFSTGWAKPHPLDGALLAYGQPFPSSLQLITSKRRPIQGGACLVPVVGLEPTRCRHQRILSPSRLPIPSHRQSLYHV